MRILFISLFICMLLTKMNGQFRITEDLKQRLTNAHSLDTIRRLVKDYYAEKKDQISPGDSISRRYINRQLKFWNRWFYDCESRLEPDGTVANWTKRMLEADVSLQAYDNSRAPNSSWTLIGPTNVNEEDGIGRVLRIGFHPTNSQIIYAGTARGGLWRSSNGGSSWANLSAFLPTLGVSGIEVSNSDPNDIFILSGEGDAWLNRGFTFQHGYVSFSNGVFKSTDSGTSWTQTADLFPGSDTIGYVGFQLRQDPNNSSTFMAATSMGLFRTTNSGGAWTTAIFNSLDTIEISPFLNNITCFDVEYKPGNSSTVYAGCRITILSNNNQRFAFFKSTNGGLNFTEIDLSSDINPGMLIRFEIGVTPAAPSNVYLACGPGFVEDGDGSDDSFLGFLKSTNNGSSFTNIATEPDVWAYNPDLGLTLGHQCMYDMALAISPTNTNYIFTGGLVVFRSTNGGVDFDGNTSYWAIEVGEHIHPDVHDLRYNPLDGKLYAATDGGVYVSANNGGAWDPIFNGMSISQFYHSENDNENGKLWGGTQDNGVLEQVSGTTFHEFDAGDGYDVMTDNVVGNGNDSYWSTNGSVVTSANLGNDDITPPDPENTGRNFGILDMHPANEDYIYVGYVDAVWYSTDQGGSWKLGSTWNRLDEGGVAGEWCMSTCPSNVQRLYTAGTGELWRVDNINFTQAATGDQTNLSNALCNEGFPCNTTGTVLFKMTDILVHPTSSGKLWVAAGGFLEGGKVFYSDNAGLSWTNISYNLPNVPANCLLRTSDGTLYVGMDAGVFYLPPGEDGWIPFYNALPRVPVTEMNAVTEFTPPSTFTPYIYASTYGRGIWKSQTFTGCTTTVNLAGTLKGQRFYQASNLISSTSLIDGVAGTDVRFQSGLEITLNTGFQAFDGSSFHGYIMPCNTGPYPDATGMDAETRSAEKKYFFSAVIESMTDEGDRLNISMHVRESGNYAINLTQEDTTWVKELKPSEEYAPGRYTFVVEKSSLPTGFYHIAVWNEEGHIHSQECQLDRN